MVTRICVLSGIYPPNIGGPAKFAVTFTDYLSKRGIPSSVITYSDTETSTEVLAQTKVMKISRKIPLPFRYLLTIQRIRQEAKKGTTFIANGCFLEILLASFTTKIQYITKVPGDIVWERARNANKTQLTVDDFQYAKLKPKLKFFRFLFSQSLIRSSRVIVPSTHLFGLCQKWGVPDDRILIIHNSVSVTKFSPRFEVSKKFDAVIVNRLVPWKGTREVIDTCGKLNLSLLVIGDGPESAALRKAAQQYKSRITFVGEARQDEIVNHLNSASIFILNSNFEATSYALLEARACGLVCIAREGTGSEEVIRHMEDGILCGSGSGMELESALRALIAPDCSLVAIGNKAREDVEKRFNSEINFSRILGACG